MSEHSSVAFIMPSVARRSARSNDIEIKVLKPRSSIRGLLDIVKLDHFLPRNVEIRSDDFSRLRGCRRLCEFQVAPTLSIKRSDIRDHVQRGSLSPAHSSLRHPSCYVSRTLCISL
jgi:hypothetical protein